MTNMDAIVNLARHLNANGQLVDRATPIPCVQDPWSTHHQNLPPPPIRNPTDNFPTNYLRDNGRHYDRQSDRNVNRPVNPYSAYAESHLVLGGPSGQNFLPRQPYVNRYFNRINYGSFGSLDARGGKEPGGSHGIYGGSSAEKPGGEPATLAMGRSNVQGFHEHPMNAQLTKPHRRELQMLLRFGEYGQSLGKLDTPNGFCLGWNDEIIIADTLNHRVQIFDRSGKQVLYVWGECGSQPGCLWQPRKVAFFKQDGRIVVSDRSRKTRRLQIFSRNGMFLRSIRSVKGAIITGLCVYRECIVVVEVKPNACMVLSQDGSTVMRFSLEAMELPSAVVVVDRKFVICDYQGHRVFVFNLRGGLLHRIGDNWPGIINFPSGVEITGAGDLVVSDTHGNRFHVSVWNPSGQFLAHYELPYIKVSRACGLGMTPEGNLVTVATDDCFVVITSTLGVPATPPPQGHTRLFSAANNSLTLGSSLVRRADISPSSSGWGMHSELDEGDHAAMLPLEDGRRSTNSWKPVTNI